MTSSDYKLLKGKWKSPKIFLNSSTSIKTGGFSVVVKISGIGLGSDLRLGLALGLGIGLRLGLPAGGGRGAS